MLQEGQAARVDCVLDLFARLKESVANMSSSLELLASDLD